MLSVSVARLGRIGSITVVKLRTVPPNRQERVVKERCHVKSLARIRISWLVLGDRIRHEILNQSIQLAKLINQKVYEEEIRCSEDKEISSRFKMNQNETTGDRSDVSLKTYMLETDKAKGEEERDTGKQELPEKVQQPNEGIKKEDKKMFKKKKSKAMVKLSLIHI